MRLTHMDRRVHVVGDATTPAIRRDDGLLVLSASGETASSISFADTASEQHARVPLVTVAPNSTLAHLAATVLTIPVETTRPFAGSLFEQACVLILDAATLTDGDPDAYRDIH